MDFFSQQTLDNNDVGLRLEMLILTRFSAKWVFCVLTGNYGENRGRLRNIPARIKGHVQNCADHYFIYIFAIYVNL